VAVRKLHDSMEMGWGKEERRREERETGWNGRVSFLDFSLHLFFLFFSHVVWVVSACFSFNFSGWKTEEEEGYLVTATCVCLATWPHPICEKEFTDEYVNIYIYTTFRYKIKDYIIIIKSNQVMSNQFYIKNVNI
jgi:hypothetical protein